jgi:hypothetical protein
MRHSLPPAGVTKRYMPPASVSLYGFSFGFACRVAVSDKGRRYLTVSWVTVFSDTVKRTVKNARLQAD